MYLWCQNVDGGDIESRNAYSHEERTVTHLDRGFEQSVVVRPCPLNNEFLLSLFWKSRVVNLE